MSDEKETHVQENRALVFIKPHAVTDSVRALVQRVFIERHITIEKEGSVAAERIGGEGIVDRHYATIARYAMEWSADKIVLSDDAKKKFTEKFTVSWDDALAQGKILNASEASKKVADNEVAKFQPKWDAAPVKVKLAPGLYVGHLADDDLYVVNGFYLANREKFTKPGTGIHWYEVRWDESKLTWETFRGQVIGPTNPKDAPESSIRGIIFKEFASLGLSSAPNVSDNGVHASAGPLEGLAERIVWLGGTLESDPFATQLRDAGADMAAVKEWLSNPVETINGKTAPVFDLLEDKQSSEVTSIIVAATKKAAVAAKENRALVFIKPHAVTDSVRALVQRVFIERHITIEKEGSVAAERIGGEGIVDRHYATIARYAMEWSADKIVLSDDAKKKFTEKFTVSWDDALAQGKILNASEASKKVADNEVAKFQPKWDAAPVKVKLAPGLYVGHLADDDLYVVNGFYLANREKFTKPGTGIHWYEVRWDESKLTWETFRGQVIGPTNPKDAPESSIRGIIFKEFASLGLSSAPNVSDNGVHASAGPLEGLAERIVWLGGTLESDPFATQLRDAGADMAAVKEWLSNPVETINGKTAPVFDLLEDKQSSEVTSIIVAATKKAPVPAEAVKKGEEPSFVDTLLENNKQYAAGQLKHNSAHPGKQPIQPSKRVAVVACMDARMDVEGLLGLQTGEAHIIRNAGGVVSEDAMRSLIISHHLLNTREFILIHHTRCGMLAFTDDLLKAGLEGDAAAEKILGQATSREFVSPKKNSVSPACFHAFRGKLEALDAPRSDAQIERLSWDVRRGLETVLNHPWLPTSGPDAITARGFIYDVDAGTLEEVSYPGPAGTPTL